MHKNLKNVFVEMQQAKLGQTFSYDLAIKYGWDTSQVEFYRKKLEEHVSVRDRGAWVSGKTLHPRAVLAFTGHFNRPNWVGFSLIKQHFSTRFSALRRDDEVLALWCQTFDIPKYHVDALPLRSVYRILGQKTENEDGNILLTQSCAPSELFLKVIKGKTHIEYKIKMIEFYFQLARIYEKQNRHLGRL